MMYITLKNLDGIFAICVSGLFTSGNKVNLSCAELYKQLPSLKEDSREERKDFFDKAGAGLQQLMGAGMELTGWL